MIIITIAYILQMFPVVCYRIVLSFSAKISNYAASLRLFTSYILFSLDYSFFVQKISSTAKHFSFGSMPKDPGGPERLLVRPQPKVRCNVFIFRCANDC